jgi:glycosyltransferase involved in cell wall biosynthesis
METKLISRMPFKKILIIINALTMGGAQMRVLKTARFLIKKNIKVYIIAFKSGEMADSFKDMGVMVNIYPFHVLHQIDLVLAIRNEILKINPSIVHTHLGAAGFFGRIAVFLARKKGWQGKTATTQHGLEKYRYRAMEPILSLVNDHLIAVSEHVKSLWYKNRRDVHVIPGSTLDKRALEFHGFSLKTSDPGPEWSIGFRGRLSREKGIDILISALGILKKRNHLVRLLISGSGPEKERLYKITQQLGLLKEITFVQHMEALEFYSRIDIFVLPSRQEGQGLALLEAMNYGCLCIGSKVGGIAETIRPNDNGILFEPQNVAALAAALEDIIKNPLKRAGITARAGEYALKHTAEKMNNKLFSLFSGCSKGRKKLLLAVSSSIIGGGDQHTLYL